MKSGNRALPMLLPVVLLYTAVSCQASETKRLRQQCIDDCRIETSTCTTNCQTGDCVEILHAASERLHKKLQEVAPAPDPLK